MLKDMKESYDMGSPLDPLYANIWPPGGVYDDFQKVMERFFGVCYRAELEVLEALEVGLGLGLLAGSGNGGGGGGGLRDLHRDGTNELRLTHYPPVRVGEFGGFGFGSGGEDDGDGKGNEARKTRIAAHTDFGSVTLLFQDSVGGLRKLFLSFFLFKASDDGEWMVG